MHNYVYTTWVVKTFAKGQHKTTNRSFLAVSASRKDVVRPPYPCTSTWCGAQKGRCRRKISATLKIWEGQWKRIQANQIESWDEFEWKCKQKNIQNLTSKSKKTFILKLQVQQYIELMLFALPTSDALNASPRMRIPEVLKIARCLRKWYEKLMLQKSGKDPRG